jgi:hypothetical protein
VLLPTPMTLPSLLKWRCIGDLFGQTAVTVAGADLPSEAVPARHHGMSRFACDHRSRELPVTNIADLEQAPR